MDKDADDRWVDKINAIIRVRFNIDPEELTDEQWAKLFQQAMYVQRVELEAQNKLFEHTLEKVAYKVVKDVFAALNKGAKDKGR